MQNGTEISQGSVDSVVEKLNNVFLHSSEKSFGHRTFKNINGSVQNRIPFSLFGKEYGVARRLFHRAKQKYNRARNNFNNCTFQNRCKDYKKTLNFYHRKYIDEKIVKLRN